MIVGAACKRLRKHRYKIIMGAYGPQIDGPSRQQLVRSVDAYVSLIGGIETAAQIFRFMRDAKLFHDGLWLFGETGLDMYDKKLPMIPVGWLISLALRHFNQTGTARKPEIAWDSLVNISRDFAAVHDCQRYTQFSDMNLHASQIHRTLANSLLWRELFTLPQMPMKALRRVLRELTAVLTEEDEERLGFDSSQLFREVLYLVDQSSDDQLTMHPREAVERTLPLLIKEIGGIRNVNVKYIDPLAVDAKTQESTLLFPCGRDKVITLPRAMLAPAACDFIFRRIWSKLGKRADNVIKETLENSIAAACRGKSSKVQKNVEYYIGKDRFEIDTATRDGDEIVLIETKGKMLTSKSRSGNMFSFFEDYSDSFLRMLRQLVRHEVHLRQGKTPLTDVGEFTDDFRPLKIAVSPLSYGAISDKVLTGNLVRAFFGVKLNLITPDKTNAKMLAKLNARIAQILSDILIVAPRQDGLAELTPYFIDVFWLDIGQLIYILDRAKSVPDAFRPLKHITFSSRDFWTELAHADRTGMTNDKWTPVI